MACAQALAEAQCVFLCSQQVGEAGAMKVGLARLAMKLHAGGVELRRGLLLYKGCTAGTCTIQCAGTVGAICSHVDAALGAHVTVRSEV